MEPEERRGSMLDTVDEEEDDGDRYRDMLMEGTNIDDEGKLTQEEIPEVPDEPSGEGRPPKTARNPRQPSRAEVIKHRLCHIPYRNWCKACVLARARDNQHRCIQGGDNDTVPRIGIDYAFMTQKGVYATEEEMEKATDEKDREGTMKIIILKEFKHGSVWAYAVDAKGAGD